MPPRSSWSAALGALLGLSLLAACAGTGPRDDAASRGAAPAAVVKPAPAAGRVVVTDEVAHDTSPPLQSIPPVAQDVANQRKRGTTRNDIAPHPTGDGFDPVTQTPGGGKTSNAPTAPAAAAPTVGVSFDGPGVGMSGFSVNSAPPDTSSAVGPSHILTSVNTGFVVQDKTGGIVYGPAANNTIFSGFAGGNGKCASTNDGDPIVRYDVLAGRWLFSQFANTSSSTGPFYECVAVSTSSNPTGSWNRYAFQYADFPDYPKFGVWPDAYYVTYNMFSAAGSWLGPKACAFDRSAMLAGTAATQQCFSMSSAYGAPLPADVDSATGPAAGSPNPMVTMGVSSTTLAYWMFDVDWATPANSTFTGPTNLTVASYTPACGGGTCISQPGTTNKLDSLGDRLMNRLAYRNMSSYEALVISHSVTSGNNTGVRWYELRRSGTSLSVYQQGTYADSTARWMPSVAMDKVGNIAIGYSAANSTTTYPSVRVTGRLVGDTLGTMTQAETTLQAGAGSQTGSLTRWGDYATMSIDPSDQCTFWFSSEYLKSTGSFNWSTRTGSFQLPGCSGPIEPDFAVTATPSSATVLAGASTTASVLTSVQGTPQTVALSVSGAPTGVTATLNPTSVTAGGTSTLTIATTGSVAAGTYPLTISGTGTSGTRSATYSLVVAPVSPPDSVVTNGTFEAGTALTGWTRSGTTAAITTPAAYSGAWSGRAGSTVATNGDSKLTTAQFTVPTGKTTLSFWYNMSCPDSVTWDWAMATLTDVGSRKTTTILPKTCTNGAGWKKVTAAVVAGRKYKLTLISHDDNYAADPTFTQFDQVIVS